MLLHLLKINEEDKSSRNLVRSDMWQMEKYAWQDPVKRELQFAAVYFYLSKVEDDKRFMAHMAHLCIH